MDLDAVPEIGPAFAAKLRDAGVESVEALAVWEDLAGLAERSGIDLPRLESFRDAARAQLERALAEAGIDGPEALAAADLDALAARTGLSHLPRYRALAQEALGRVVLVDGAPVARVTVAGQTHHAVPLVTAGVADDDGEVLARAGGDAVLLKPQVDAVPALVAGVAHKGLPLYKERRTPEGATEEVRVRVAEIREVPEVAPKKPGVLGKLFGKRK